MLDLEAIELIKQPKARYFRFLDTGNYEELETCFTADAAAYFKGGNDEFTLNGWTELEAFCRHSITKKSLVCIMVIFQTLSLQATLALAFGISLIPLLTSTTIPPCVALRFTPTTTLESTANGRFSVPHMTACSKKQNLEESTCR